MDVAIFSAQPYEKELFNKINKHYSHTLSFFDSHLRSDTLSLAENFPCVCCFVNDKLTVENLQILSEFGVKMVALRSAGFNHVDIKAAEQLGIPITRVPIYSPHAVAEHAVALILALDRKIHRAYNRVRENDFSLHGLMGFDLYGKTVGVIGTGNIGEIFARIMQGFGCIVLGHDVAPNNALKGVEYVALDKLLQQSDIISLHCPLTPQTHHLIDSKALNQIKLGAMLINTSRGAVIDALAAIESLKSGHLGYLGLDVYEEEGDLFFEDLSDQVIQDDVFARLHTFPNVIVTGHQAFFTREAMDNIIKTTLENITAFENKNPLDNQVTAADFLNKG